MKKLFFDTEFTGLHQKTTLISIGIAAENGKKFYGEFTDYDRSQVDRWITENVIDHLNVPPEKDLTICVGNTATIESGLRKWLAQFGKIQMWSDCLSYDWVLFCNIFEHAFKIPSDVHYIPMDIATLFFAKGIDPDINREEFAQKVGGTKHNALHDAVIISECYYRLLTK